MRQPSRRSSKLVGLFSALLAAVSLSWSAGALGAGPVRTPRPLSFDEADALFGKRTSVRDSHDRFSAPKRPDATRGSGVQGTGSQTVKAAARNKPETARARRQAPQVVPTNPK